VHNLQSIDLRLPLHKLIVISGVSGSGKSSLAFDTLFAEGQRRYIECFSAYARQFLVRLEKPDADRIDHIPPAIAVRHNSVHLGGKSTVATVTEIHDYLRLLFARSGRVTCPNCEQEIRQENPDTVARVVAGFRAGTRFQICFPIAALAEVREPAAVGQEGGGITRLREQGFVRAVIAGRTVELRETHDFGAEPNSQTWIVVDRLVAGKATTERVLESLELAFRSGNDRCLLLEALETADGSNSGRQTIVDGRPWRLHRFHAQLVCESCDREFAAPQPRLLSFNTPLGACPECRGFGSVPAISLERLVPDPSKSLRDGAISAWTTPAYRHELDELIVLADDYGLPVDVPFDELQPQHLKLITDGVSERNFGGLKGFFRWLERNQYKLSVRVFLNRWRTYETCPACRGDRLQPDALAVRLAGRNLAELCRLPIVEVQPFLERLDEQLSTDQGIGIGVIRDEVRSRLRYLVQVGLGYLTLDRPVRTLSGGEARRVALTAALGSRLVNALYVLDEPSAGLHPRDSERVIEAIQRLRDGGSTVVVVEHEEAFLRAADEIVDIGPGAGRQGGRIVFQGPPEKIVHAEDSLTGTFLSGARNTSAPAPDQRRKRVAGQMTLSGACRHNLKNLTVEFPLGVLCVVTGVSGSGKSTLVQETLFPAICRRLKQACTVSERSDYDRLEGADQIDEVVLVDPAPIGRTPRSNPVTFLKAFDDIRAVFAQTPDAKLRNLTATDFSFNAARGGRCPQCSGKGSIQIEMQFLADVLMTCPECQGRRYRREILEAKYRGLSIADVLEMTVREAFTFFRTQPRLLKKLNLLKQVGLDYLPLGQPTTTLSGGESQRLKLASFLASGSRQRTLFLIDEPTTGLHRADVAHLLDCFNSLLLVGRSLIVVEHNLDVIKSADYVIDLGPDAGDAGGEVIVCGTPEDVAAAENSITGRYLLAAGVTPARQS